MSTTFRSTNYPTLVFGTSEGRQRFIGGRLELEDEATVEAVAAFAEANPHYGITREDAPESAPETPEAPKRETVDEVIARVGDDKEAALEALEAEQDADEPRVTLIAKLEEILEAGE